MRFLINISDFATKGSQEIQISHLFRLKYYMPIYEKYLTVCCIYIIIYFIRIFANSLLKTSKYVFVKSFLTFSSLE